MLLEKLKKLFKKEESADIVNISFETEKYKKLNLDIKELKKLMKDKSVNQELEQVFSKIIINSSKKGLDEINEAEKLFFLVLLSLIKMNKIKYSLKLQRLHDRTFNVFLTEGLYIGKIKIGSKKNFMQLPRTIDKMDQIEGFSDEHCIKCSPIWIKYIKRIMRSSYYR